MVGAAALRRSAQFGPGRDQSRGRLSGAAARSRELKKTSPLAVLGLDDPNIRIEFYFPRKFPLDFGRIDPLILVHPREDPVEAILHFALRGGSEQGRAAVEPINLDENRASFSGAATAQDRACALVGAAP